MTDEEICLLAEAGSTAAEEALVQRYGRMVRACARPLFLAGGDSEDLFQEGMMGLLSAVRSFEREGTHPSALTQRSASAGGCTAPSGRPKAANTSL